MSSIPLMRVLASRSYLFAAAAISIAVFFAAWPWIPSNITRALIGWNIGVLVYLGMAFSFMTNVDIERMKGRALSHDEGGHAILVVTILAAVASIGALVAELSDAKGHSGAGMRVALAAMTVVLSWLFMQIVFAMHYAHLYYLAEKQEQPRGGLDFGEEGEPDYWDFVHFAIVMGATAQTADITFSSRHMRRIGTLHSLVAFGFNTAILATMINIAASLF